jgi:hypothetical protein
MINEALEYIQRELRDYLGIDDADAIINHAHLLKEPNNAKGVYISLVNLEEEKVLKNTRHSLRINDQTVYQQPPVFLNLYVLFSFEFTNYSTSLLHLSKTIERFQSKSVFSAETATAANPFPSGLNKLIFDFHNLNFEQLNHLWGVLGGAYFPSVLYKVRMVKVQLEETVAAPEITRIEVDAGLK